MKFRPCIDIHNGQVKQIVGGSLKDEGDQAEVNFVSGQDAAYYAALYRRDGLAGGHVILLNGKDSPYYEETRKQALAALHAYPGGLQLGGGITAETAADYLAEGASHVIVTSYVFTDGIIDWDALQRLVCAVGKKRIVLDVSCREKAGKYYIVTNRWQTFTAVPLTLPLLEKLSGYCDEFLVHGVDAEGKSSGVSEELVKLLTGFDGIPVTYAGGIGTLQELEEFRRMSRDRLDFTIGSALDLFGGEIPYEAIMSRAKSL